MTWLTLYRNESTLPITASWLGNPSAFGAPSIQAGGLRMWDVGGGIRLVATLDTLVTL